MQVIRQAWKQKQASLQSIKAGQHFQLQEAYSRVISVKQIKMVEQHNHNILYKASAKNSQWIMRIAYHPLVSL